MRRAVIWTTMLGFAGVLLTAQVERAVPVAEEPLHRVLFENAYVRVIDAVLPAGAKTLPHTHARDNVPVNISGGTLVTTSEGRASLTTTPRPGQAWFAAGGYTHQITNTGSTTVRFIDAEILAAAARTETAPAAAHAAPAATTADPRELVLDGPRVRIYRVRAAPGVALPAHDHGGPGLTIAVTGARVAVRAGPDAREHVATPGAFWWRDAGESHQVENRGPGAAELIEIDWK